MLSRSTNSQNTPWYSSLKSISIYHPTCTQAFWMDSFLHVFQSKLSSGLPSLPCMLYSLPICHCSLILYYLTSSINYETPHYPFFSSHCLPSVQTSFSSLCSQTEPAYKWQKALVSLQSPFLCHSYHAFSYNLYFNVQNLLIKSNKTDHKPHFILHINYHIFQHQDAIFSGFIKKQRSVCPTRASHPHFHHKN